MRKFKAFLLTGIIVSIGIVFISCSNKSEKSPIDTETTSNNLEIENNYTSTYYSYIDEENNLLIKDKINGDTNLISSGVIEFGFNAENLVYLFKDSDGKHLSKYNFETKKTTTIKDYYNNEFIINDDFLYLVEESSITQYNLRNDENEMVTNIENDDIILNYVDDDFLIYTGATYGLPKTKAYVFSKKTTVDLFEDATNITKNGEYIYGIDNNLNIFRYNTLTTEIDTIKDFLVLDFYIDDNYLVYIDKKGALNSLDLDGTNRVIANYVTDFEIFEDTIYYSTNKSKNIIYKTQFNGNHKEAIIENSNANFNFKSM